MIVKLVTNINTKTNCMKLNYLKEKKTKTITTISIKKTKHIYTNT